MHPDTSRLKRIEGGLLLACEGGEGSGKTTTARALQQMLTADGYDVLVTHEPGDTTLGKKLRSIVIDTDLAHGDIDGYESLFIFAADRHAHIRQIITPALTAGKIVLCDRYIYSSFVYQEIEGVEPNIIKTVNDLAIDGLTPMRTYWFNASPKIAMDRIAAENRNEKNKNDAAVEPFHAKVRAGFQKLCAENPGQIIEINADQPARAVSSTIYNDIVDLIASATAMRSDKL